VTFGNRSDLHCDLPRRLFGQPQLRIIFEDYLAPQSRAAVRFSPQEDPRINVTAKLGVDAALGLRNGHPGIVSHSHPTASRSTPDSAGSMTLRYQPDPAVPWTFADIKTRVGTASDTVVLRACYLDSSSGTAVFSTLPLTSSYEGSYPRAHSIPSLPATVTYAMPLSLCDLEAHRSF